MSTPIFPGGIVTWTDKQDTIEADINSAFAEIIAVENVVAANTSQLEDNAIKPENFTGTDYEKLQQAFDLSLTDARAICISKTYDIGANTIILKKPLAPRRATHVFGGGTIQKSVAGFIFNSSVASSSDYFFESIKFDGLSIVGVKVFDCSNASLIRVTTSKCFFNNLDTIYYSNTYIQTIKMNEDTVMGCTNSVFDIQGCLNVILQGILCEGITGYFINHGGTGIYPMISNMVIQNCCLEGFYSNPVFRFKNVFNLSINGCYFEQNMHGSILFQKNSTLTNVSIEDCHHEGIVDFTSLIQWGQTLINCSSKNNLSTVIPIHDTTSTTSGYVISFNDKGASPMSALANTNLYIQDSELASGMTGNETFINILLNSNPKSLENWSNWVGSLTLKTDIPYSGTGYLSYNGDTAVQNSYCFQNITAIFDSTTSKYLVYFVSKGTSIEPFIISIQDGLGSSWGVITCYPTKLNQWEIYCSEIVVTNPNSGNNNYYLSLYPALSTNSANKSRDFDCIALYKTNKSYNLSYFAKAVGYTFLKTGVGYNKFDINGDGIADIPYGTTAQRPILNTLQAAFIYFDTTLNKPIWWSGTSWKDANNANPDSRGIGVTVPIYATTLVVTFVTVEADALYAPIITTTWNTTSWVTNKLNTGFTINFGTAPLIASTLSWSIKR